jgi:hypothetical protein
MTRKFSVVIVAVGIFLSINAAAYAQDAANDKQEEIVKRWTENCRHVARFSQELIFTVRLAEPKGTATNRKDLLDILSSIKLDDAPKVKKMQTDVIAAVNKAPKFTDNYGKSDMSISKELDKNVDDFLASVSSEAEKHNVKCK